MCDEAAIYILMSALRETLSASLKNCREAAFAILREEISALWKH